LTSEEISIIEQETFDSAPTLDMTKDITTSSTDLDKIYNPLTKRYIKNTPTNQKKIEQFSLKKTAAVKEEKIKKSRNKKTRNKKSQKQKYKKSRTNKTRSNKTRKIKV
jgi:hypothetical protein